MRLPRSLVAAALLLPAAAFALPRGVTPLRSGGRSSGPARAAHAPAAPANAHLFYYGGPVISNVHVVPVFWGANVPSTVTSQIGEFYSAVTDSTLFDFLAEYDTNVADYAGNQGTGQHIGRGTAAAPITITPSITGNVTDAQITTELKAQIAAGHLPSQTADTLYMIHFPAGMSISMPDGNGGTAASCKQFCAYHSTIAASTNIFYGVIPNVTTDGCELGCGPVGGGFNNTCSVASHELIEAVTDAAVGLATANAPPLAWYDPQGSNGEIGDICNADIGTIISHNKTWSVQKEWSNTHNACIAEAGSVDFAVSLHPDNHDIAAGHSATYTVTTTKTAAQPGTITLDATGLPTGITATFSKTSLAPGDTATVTIAVSTAATNGADYFTIHGTSGGVSHDAEAQATVTGGAGSGGTGGGGGCPAGTVDLGNGVCVPTGCSGGAEVPTWLALVGVAAFLSRKRRAQA